MAATNRMVQKQRPTQMPQRPQRADWKSNPISGLPWGQALWPHGAATGATEGTPGTWDPEGAVPPDLATLIEWDPTPDPTAAWGNDYILVGDGTAVQWDGDEWVSFDATGATAGDPGSFTPAGSNIPADYAALVLAAPTADPATAWTEGQHVVLGDDSLAYWDADSWEEGEAPA